MLLFRDVFCFFVLMRETFIKLKPKHQTFADLLLAGFHPTKAAHRVGFKSPKGSGNRLSKDPRIIAYMEEVKAYKEEELNKDKIESPETINFRKVAAEAQSGKRFDYLNAQYDRLIRELYVIGTVDPKMMFDEHGQPLHIKDMPAELRHAISDVTITIRNDENGSPVAEHKIKFHSKVNSIKILLDHVKKEINNNTSDKEKLERLQELRAKSERFKQ